MLSGGIPMETLAGYLARDAGRRVVDRNALRGHVSSLTQ
jgi:hypothetical protein